MLALVAVAASRVDWRGSAEALAAADPVALAVATVAVGLSTLLKGIAWRTLVGGLRGVDRVGAADAVGALVVCGLVNGVAVGNAGEAAKLAVLRRRLGGGATLAGLAGTVLAERLVSVAGLGAVALAVGLTAPGAAPVWIVAAATGAVSCALCAAARAVPSRPCPAPCGTGGASWVRAQASGLWARVREATAGAVRPAALPVVGIAGAGQWLAMWIAAMACLAAIGESGIGWGAAGC